MMRTAFGLSCLLLLGLGAALGCSSKEVSDNGGGSGSVCDTYCAQLTECDTSQSAAACQANCQGQYDADKLGSAFGSYVNTCLGMLDCAEYNAGTALTTCSDQAIADGTPSGAGTSFCDDLQAKLADCGIATSTSITDAECTGRVRKYNDAAVNQASACLEGDCATVVGCINGAIPPASSGSGGSGNTGGAGNTGGGNTGGAGNTAGTGVTGGTGTAGSGGAAPACPLTCVDDMTAQYCDSITGEMMTVNCAEVFAEDGLISNGCLSDATGDGCTVDGLADMACADGAVPFAYCANLTQDDLLDVYVGCFHDMNGAHTVIPCYFDFWMETAMPPIDCVAADAACLPAPPAM